MAELVKTVVDYVYKHVKLIYVIIPAVIAIIMMFIPSKKMLRWEIGIFIGLIALCFIYLILMVICTDL